MLVLDYTWTVPAAGSSSPTLNGVEIKFGPSYTVLYATCSTLASTQSFSLQTAPTSTGPWIGEGSTSLPGTATVSGGALLRLTGPYRFVRPLLNSVSTGTYTFRLIGVE